MPLGWAPQFERQSSERSTPYDIMEDVRPKLEVTRSETLENVDPNEETTPRSDLELRLHERFALALRAWDVHVGSCSECLREGLHLCAEGAFAYDDCEQARDRLTAFATRQALAAARISVPSVSGLGVGRPSPGE